MVSGWRVHLEGKPVKFVYEGYRVKVKVTGAKKRENSYSRNATKIPIPGNNSGSVKDTAAKFACIMGFSL